MYYHMINWSYSIKFCLPLHLRIFFTVVVNFKVLESVMMFRFKLFGSTSGLWILLPSHFTGPLGHISSFVTFDKSIFYIDEFTIPQTWRLIKKKCHFPSGNCLFLSVSFICFFERYRCLFPGKHKNLSENWYWKSRMWVVYLLSEQSSCCSVILVRHEATVTPHRGYDQTTAIKIHAHFRTDRMTVASLWQWAVQAITITRVRIIMTPHDCVLKSKSICHYHGTRFQNRIIFV